MKRNAFLLTALSLSLALAVPVAAPLAAAYAESSSQAAAGTTIDAAASVAAGSSVSISGTTNAAEVIVKVISPDSTILFFDIVKSADGRYSTSFQLPSAAAVGSSFQVIAGQGTDVSTRTITVVSNGSGIPSSPVDNGNPAAPDGVTTVPFKPSDVSSAVNGIATLDASKVTAAKSDLQIPASVIPTIGNNSFRILLPNGTVTLPKEVLSALSELAGSDKDASLSLQFSKLTSSEALAAVAKLGEAGTGIKPQGQVIELILAIVFKDGSKKKLSSFTKPVTLQLQLSEGADARLAGIYYLSDGGVIEYIGGTLKGNILTAEVGHFSQYGVFSYTKKFADVPTTHWAADVIEELTAKHVVQGISTDSFGPKANVTRAEFVTMLVRALGLKATGEAPFTDIKAGSWYAEATAAAYENDITSGAGAGKFEPTKPITREEMALMITRVYEKQHGQASGSATDIDSFKDKNAISSWAKEAVEAAVHEGLMVGSNQLFSPRSHTTRAESAQVLYNLLFRA
ncbi:S-layer homology domain-containing protein [Paenibacillus sp. CF384]|uniref:S-layer homology domain-containing protein n=1 Tax=Paenibacillus sp. CF384 TaxID=1884382 RepID=UPI00089B3A08|nr:S-layer homology domain-containing protein [Paenibacillus sp. CF384]SDX22657.1 S-layer homology domain-containing protein [Paenibacillus sp. CF384]